VLGFRFVECTDVSQLGEEAVFQIRKAGNHWPIIKSGILLMSDDVNSFHNLILLFNINWPFYSSKPEKNWITLTLSFDIKVKSSKQLQIMIDRPCARTRQQLFSLQCKLRSVSQFR